MFARALLPIAVVAALPAAAPAGAAVLTVGPGHRFATPCRAIAAARPGDRIAIDARGNGRYDGDVCTWATDRLTIAGVHGRARIDAAGRNSGGKGTWVVDGDHTRIEDVELSGARVPDGNGAGIRAEGAGLTLAGVYLHDNQDGILANPSPASDIVITGSEFARNGAGDGYSHNIYIGAVRSFTLRGSWSHDAVVGHLVKSRARINRILYDRLTGERGTSSYELDLPQGGRSTVIGNVIEQGPSTENPALVAFGEEGDLHPGSTLSLVNNTFVDGRHGTAVLVGAQVRAPVLAQNNLVTGAAAFVGQATARLRTNCITAIPRFARPARYDYRLRRGSPCVDAGSVPPPALVPRREYAYDRRTRARVTRGRAIDAGAFERP